jgi:hypothetical protein
LLQFFFQLEVFWKNIPDFTWLRCMCRYFHVLENILFSVWFNWWQWNVFVHLWWQWNVFCQFVCLYRYVLKNTCMKFKYLEDKCSTFMDLLINQLCVGHLTLAIFYAPEDGILKSHRLYVPLSMCPQTVTCIAEGFLARLFNKNK